MNKFKMIYIIPIILVLLGVVFLTSSKSENSDNLKPLNVDELKLWSNHGDTIFCKNQAVAIFEHYEYEYNPNHRKKIILAELCFIQIDDNPDNTIGLIRYIYTLHGTSKIQVEFKDQYDKINYWKSNLK
jgi:hypothetical protein